MKPRVLYFAVFVYFSLSGGRFTATFLEHELQFNENWMISGAMAVQLLSSSLCKPWLTGVADSWEASSSSKSKKEGGENNKGRLLVMSLGLLLSTVATLLQGLGPLYMHWNSTKIIRSDNHPDGYLDLDGSIDDNGIFNNNNDNNNNYEIPRWLLAYHLFLRAIAAMGSSGIMPILDGITLSHLDREGRNKHEYGKERVYGAVSWGIANIALGPVIDMFGFKTLYVSTVLSFVGCMVTFHLYAKSASMNSNECVEIGEAIGFAEVGDYLADEKKCTDEPMEQNEEGTCNNYQNDASFGGNDFLVNDADDIANNNESARPRLTFLQLVQLVTRESPILNTSYIISLFTLFIGMSVVESLVFLFFEFLGGSNTMCGLTVVVTVLFELPLFHCASEMLEFIGSPQSMLQIACLAYVVRVVGYSIVPSSHPYWVLLLEPLHGITIAFATTSSVAVADSWMTPSMKGYEASGQALVSMVRGLGQFVGFCIAGYLEGRTLYRVLAVIVTFGALLLGMGSYISTSRTKARANYVSL